MDIVTGFVTELTAEKRGPKKHYRRFNILTREKEIIPGWIFSLTEIENTIAGNILLAAANSNTAISLRGKITSDESNIRTIKVSINSKLDNCIEWAGSNITRPDTKLIITSIRDALRTNAPCRLEAVVLDQNDELKFIQNEKERKYKSYIIGDASGTTQILIYDDLIDKIVIADSFIFTQIKWKKILDNIILTTTPTTTISKTTNIIVPNMDDMDETMSMKLIDIEEINTNFQEIIYLKQEQICSSCKQILTPIPNKEHLLKCNTCSKYSLFNKNDFDINVVIHLYDQNLTFKTKKGLLQQFFEQENPKLTPTADNLSEFFLMHGPWNISISHVRYELTNINKH